MSTQILSRIHGSLQLLLEAGVPATCAVTVPDASARRRAPPPPLRRTGPICPTRRLLDLRFNELGLTIAGSWLEPLHCEL